MKKDTTTPQQDKPVFDRDIETKVYNVYCEEGQAQAFKEANKYGDRIVYEKCPAYACDTETPTLKGQHCCLICGLETKPINEPPPAKEVLQDKHTQGEWIAHNRNNDDYIDIECNGQRITSLFIANENGETGEQDNEFNNEQKANAALIVKACNSYQSLVEALENLCKVAAHETKDLVAWDGTQQLDAAIDRAKQILNNH